MKRFLILFMAFCFWSCENQQNENVDSAGTIENYRLINPNNLYNKCQGYLMLNHTSNKYSMLYDFTCIYKKDTVKFHFTESGVFSDDFMLVSNLLPDDKEWYYFSGKFSFTPEQGSPWLSTYKFSDGTGFDKSFINPVPRLITKFPVYDHNVIFHVLDSVETTVIKPWIEVLPVETGKCDSLQLYWL
jgi:hypothetical protein